MTKNRSHSVAFERRVVGEFIAGETIGEVRRPYFARHSPIKEIVRTLSVSRTTLRRLGAAAGSTLSRSSASRPRSGR